MGLITFFKNLFSNEEEKNKPSIPNTRNLTADQPQEIGNIKPVKVNVVQNQPNQSIDQMPDAIRTAYENSNRQQITTPQPNKPIQTQQQSSVIQGDQKSRSIVFKDQPVKVNQDPFSLPTMDEIKSRNEIIKPLSNESKPAYETKPWWLDAAKAVLPKSLEKRWGLTEKSLQDLAMEVEDTRASLQREKKTADVFKQQGITKDMMQNPLNYVPTDYKEPEGFLGSLKEGLVYGYYTSLKGGLAGFNEQLSTTIASPEGIARAEKLRDETIADIIKRPELMRPSDLKDFFKGGALDPRWYGRSVGEMIPFIASVAVAGTVGGVVAGPAGSSAGVYSAIYASESGNAYNQMIDDGIDPEKARKGSILYGAIAARLEMSMGINPAAIFGSTFKQSAGEVVKKTLLETAYNTIKKESGHVLKTILEEGAEEVAQQFSQNIIQKYFDKNSPLWDGLAESFAQGGVGGAMFSGGGKVLTSVPDVFKSAVNKSQEQIGQTPEIFNQAVEKAKFENPTESQLIEGDPSFSIKTTLYQVAEGQSVPVDVKFDRVLPVEGDQHDLVQQLADSGYKPAQDVLKDYDHIEADKVIQAALANKVDAIRFTVPDVSLDGKPVKTTEYLDLQNGTYLQQSSEKAVDLASEGMRSLNQTNIVDSTDLSNSRRQARAATESQIRQFASQNELPVRFVREMFVTNNQGKVVINPDTGRPIRAFGAYDPKNNTITITDYAKGTTAKHEVAEYYWDKFVTAEEKKAILAEARQKFGDKSDNVLKEEVMDAFAEYQSTGKTSLKGKIKAFFDKLLSFIKNLSKTDDSKMEQFFKNIENRVRPSEKEKARVAEEQKPKKIYHGSRVPISKIIENGFKFGKNSFWGEAAFFTTSEDIQQEFSSEEGNVISLNIDDFNFKDVGSLTKQQNFIDDMGAVNLADAVRKEGKFDGFFITNPNSEVGTTYAVTNKEKLDSIISKQYQKEYQSEDIIDKSILEEAKKYKNGIDFYQEMPNKIRDLLRDNGVKGQNQIEAWFNLNVEPSEPILDTLNPTGGLYVEYTPKERATMKLAPNMTTLDRTSNASPDQVITIYRGAPKNQKSIVPGDFITDIYDLAQSYAGNGHVIEKDVRMSDILDDLDAPLGNEYIYRPKNLQYQSEEVIPESERPNRTFEQERKLDVLSNIKDENQRVLYEKEIEIINARETDLTFADFELENGYQEFKKLLSGRKWLLDSRTDEAVAKDRIPSKNLDNLLFNAEGLSNDEMLDLYKERYEQEKDIKALASEKTPSELDEAAKKKVEKVVKQFKATKTVTKKAIRDIVQSKNELVIVKEMTLLKRKIRSIARGVKQGRMDMKKEMKTLMTETSKLIKRLPKAEQQELISEALKVNTPEKLNLFLQRVENRLRKGTDKILTDEKTLLKKRLQMLARGVREGRVGMKKEIQGYAKFVVKAAKEMLSPVDQGRIIMDIAKANTPKQMVDAIFKIAEIADIREGKEAVSRIKKSIKKAKEATRTGKGIAVEYQKRILELTKDFDPTTPTQKTLDSLSSFAEYLKNNPEASEGIPKEHIAKLDRLGKINPSQMTTAEKTDMADTLETLLAHGRMKLKLLQSASERVRKESLKQLLSTTKNLDVTQSEEVTEWQKKKASAKRTYMRFFHFFRVADAIDGYAQYQGNNVQLQRLGANAETKAKITTVNTVSDTMDAIKAIKNDWSKEDQVAMTYRLMIDQGADTQAEAVLNRHAKEDPESIKKLADTSEIKSIAKILVDGFAKRQSDIAAVYEMLENKPFQKVDNYFPIYYDKSIKNQLEAPPSIDELLNQGNYQRTKTEQGFTQSRVSGVKKVPRIDFLNVFAESVKNHNWYIEVQPVLTNINSLINTPEYMDAAGEIAVDAWKEWISSMAKQGKTYTKHPIIRTLRFNVSQAMLGYKMTSIAVQPFAIFEAIAYIQQMKLPSGYSSKVAAARVLKEFSKSWLNPWYSGKIEKQSEMLQLRAGGEIAIEEGLDYFDPAQKPGIAKRAYQKFQKSALQLLQIADMKTAAGVRQGVYNTLIKAGLEKDAAAKEADFVMNIVSSSSEVADRPLVLTEGEGAKAFFTFQTYAMNVWGMLAHDLITSGLVKGKVGRKASAVLGIAILMMGAQLADEMRDWLSRKTRADYKSKKKSLSGTALDMLFYVPEQIPAIGGVLYSARRFGDASFNLPITRPFEQLVGAAFRLSSADTQKKKTKALKDLAEGASSLFGVSGTAQFFDLLPWALQDLQVDDVKNALPSRPTRPTRSNTSKRPQRPKRP